MQLGRSVSLVCVLTALLASSGFAQSAGYRTRDRQSRTRNANRSDNSRSIGEFPAKNLPAEFAILRTRTIFSRDRMAAQSPDTSRGGGRSSANPPSSPIFRGVLSENGMHLAGIERGTSSITWYREGQSLRDGGRITQISLDQLTITQQNGDRRIIPVGDRLDAGTAVARESGRGDPTTQPADSRFSRRDDLAADE